MYSYVLMCVVKPDCSLLRRRIFLYLMSHRVVGCQKTHFPVSAPHGDVCLMLIDTVACIVPWRRRGYEDRHIKVVKLISCDVDDQLAIRQPDVGCFAMSAADVPERSKTVQVKVVCQ